MVEVTTQGGGCWAWGSIVGACGSASGIPGMVGGERNARGLLSLYPKMLGFSVVYVHKYMYSGKTRVLGGKRGTYCLDN